jgi:hypothetical protein
LLTSLVPHMTYNITIHLLLFRSVYYLALWFLIGSTL